MESLTGDEALELLRRQRVSEERLRNNVVVKREKRDRSVSTDEDGDTSDVEIEHEAITRKRHRTSQDSGVELIDLTDD